jgi:hypothetical protein
LESSISGDAVVEVNGCLLVETKLINVRDNSSWIKVGLLHLLDVELETSSLRSPNEDICGGELSREGKSNSLETLDKILVLNSHVGVVVGFFKDEVNSLGEYTEGIRGDEDERRTSDELRVESGTSSINWGVIVSGEQDLVESSSNINQEWWVGSSVLVSKNGSNNIAQGVGQFNNFSISQVSDSHLRDGLDYLGETSSKGLVAVVLNVVGEVTSKENAFRKGKVGTDLLESRVQGDFVSYRVSKERWDTDILGLNDSSVVGIIASGIDSECWWLVRELSEEGLSLIVECSISGGIQVQGEELSSRSLVTELAFY